MVPGPAVKCPLAIADQQRKQKRRHSHARTHSLVDKRAPRRRTETEKLPCCRPENAAGETPRGGREVEMKKLKTAINHLFGMLYSTFVLRKVGWKREDARRQDSLPTTGTFSLPTVKREAQRQRYQIRGTCVRITLACFAFFHPLLRGWIILLSQK